MTQSKFSFYSKFLLQFEVVDNKKFVRQESQIINLLDDDSLNPFDFIKRDFIISTENRSYKFSKDMIKDTSSIINALIENDSNFSQFHLNIDDSSNTMEKFERLYFNEQVTFYQEDFYTAGRIIEKLDLHNFPSFDSDKSQLTIKIKKESLKSFLQRYFHTFDFIYKERNTFFSKISSIGVNSSLVIKNQKLCKYNYYGGEDEYNLIRNFFNFNDIYITQKTILPLKKIVEELKIEFLLNKIKDFNNYKEFTNQVLNNKKHLIEPVQELFEYLYNRKQLSAEEVKEEIIETTWFQTEEKVQEFVSCILQVIYSDINLHPFLIKLIELLDENKSDKKYLKIMIPFLVQKLMMNIGINMLNCAFIYRLYHKNIITKEELVETIYKKLKTEDQTSEHKPINFINNYLNKTESKFDDSSKNNSIVWFFPELIEIKHFDLDELSLYPNYKQFIKKYFPNDITKFKEMRDKCEPDDKITKALRQDDIEELKRNYSPNEEKENIIPFNIFEYFISNGQTNYIDYSAAYGSIKCFKYLTENIEEFDENTYICAVFGQNTQIIESIKENVKRKFSTSCSFPNLSNKCIYDFFNNKSLDIKLGSIIPTILKHNDALFDNKYESTDYNDRSIFPLLVENYNINLVVKFIKEKNILTILSKQQIYNIIKMSANLGYYSLCELLLSIIFHNFGQTIYDPSNILDIEDSITFGNFSIFTLYASLNIKNLNFKESLSIAIIKEYSSIVEYSLMYPFIQQYQLTTEDINDILKLTIYKKNTNFFNYFIERLGKHIITNSYSQESDDSLLNYACIFNNHQAAKTIIDLIIENQPITDCTIPFLNSLKLGQDEIYRYMIEKKVRIKKSIIIDKIQELSKLSKKAYSIIFDFLDPQTEEVFQYSFLSEAIKSHNKELIEFLLEQNVPYDNALLEAASINDDEIINLILEHDSSPSFINQISIKGTALNITVNSGNINITKRLLSITGIEPSINVNNETPLISAFAHFNIKIINLLYDFYGDNIQSQTWQINIAINRVLENININNNISLAPAIIQKILEIKNIDINCIANNYSILTYACEFNQKDIVEKIIRYENINLNSFVDKNGSTPLMISIENNNFEIAKFLLQDERVNVNLRNISGCTALIIASKKGQVEIVDHIINNKRFNPIESKVDHAFMISTKDISHKLLSIKSLNVNNLNTKKRNSLNEPINTKFKFNFSYPMYGLFYVGTPLTYAVSNEDIEKVEMIINHHSFDPIKSQINKAICDAVKFNYNIIFRKLLPFINNDVNYHNENDESLLLISSKLNNKMSETMIEIVTNSKFDSYKSQINDVFASFLSNEDKVSIDVFNFLLKHDNRHVIDFTQHLPNGKSYFTVLHPNKKNLNIIIPYLMKQGADPNLPDKYGETPLQYAITSKSYYYVNELINSQKIDLHQQINFSIQYSNNIDTNVTSTYLHLASKVGNINIFKRINDLKIIDINERDNQGETSLMISVRYNNYDIITEIFKNEELNYKDYNNRGENVLNISNHSHFPVIEKTKEETLKKLLNNNNDSSNIPKFKFTFNKNANANNNTNKIPFKFSFNKNANANNNTNKIPFKFSFNKK